MIELLVGDDEFSCEQYVRSQREALGPPETASLNYAALDGASATPDALAAAAHAVPFLAERRLVVISRLVSRLSGTGGSTGRRKAAKAGQTWEPWIPVFQAIPDWTTVLLVETGTPDGDRRRAAPSLPDEIAPMVVRRELNVPRGEALVRWVSEYARQLGARLANGVAGQLVETVGEDTRRLAIELEKLTAYADGQPITAEAVQLLVSASRDANVFELADAVLERDRFRAIALTHNLLDQGLSPQYLLVMLERQFRLALAALDLDRRGAASLEARRQAGLGSDFVYRKALSQSKRYTAAQLIRRIELLCELDSSVKTGAIDEELGLDLLVASARRSRASGG